MSLKENNEITVRINCDIEDLYKILDNKGYIILEKFNMNDWYFVPNIIDLKNTTEREILKKAVIVREIYNETYKKSFKIIIFKKKEIDNEGNIISQEAINCNIIEIESAKKLLEAMGYREIMNIKEKDIVYTKDGISFAIKDITNGEKLIEIETEDKNGMRTVEELKETLIKLDLPVDTKDFFVKKAEIELNKVLKHLQEEK